MRNPILLILTCIPILIVSCSNTKNENFDLSNLKIPTQTKNKISSKKTIASISNEKEIVRNKLIPYPKVSQILDPLKIGKKDPFSVGEFDEFESELKITGFLNTGETKYVFVIYGENEGTLSEFSIGGLNTNLLPNGAKVTEIDTNNSQLTIKFDNKNYNFKLN